MEKIAATTSQGKESPHSGRLKSIKNWGKWVILAAAFGVVDGVMGQMMTEEADAHKAAYQVKTVQYCLSAAPNKSGNTPIGQQVAACLSTDRRSAMEEKDKMEAVKGFNAAASVNAVNAYARQRQIDAVIDPSPVHYFPGVLQGVGLCEGILVAVGIVVTVAEKNNARHLSNSGV